METPPPLLSADLAVPDDVQALPHVVDLISSFLMPKTIDAAVFNDLHRVIRIYGDFRPWTVGAMDGAAARGRLDLLRWLHVDRVEGCSIEAFTGAAANGHLGVLVWLRGVYPSLFNLSRDLATAARHGRAHVAAALRRGVLEIDEVEPALEAAAMNGYAAVIEKLLPGPYDMTRPLFAAVRNGHLAVVQLLCDESFKKAIGHTNIATLLIKRCRLYVAPSALELAASRGYQEIAVMILDRYKLDHRELASVLTSAASNEDCDMVKLLVGKCPLLEDTQAANKHFFLELAAGDALRVVVKADRVDVAKLVVEKLGPSDYELADALEESIQNEQESMTKFLLQRLPSKVPGFLATGHTTIGDDYPQLTINIAFYSAAENGRVSMVRLLAERISDKFGASLVAAATNNHLAVTKTLLELCEERNIPRCVVYRSIEEALSVTKNAEMMKLLAKSKTRYDNSEALKEAVLVRDLKKTKLFVKKNSPSSIAIVLLDAPTECSAILEVLVEHSDQETIERALMQSRFDKKTRVLRLLLKKCDPGAYIAIFMEAVVQSRTALMQLMLDKIDSATLTRVLLAGVVAGNLALVKLLRDVCDASSVSFAMETAAFTGQSPIVDLLRGRCDAKTRRSAAARATAAGYDDVAWLLTSKKTRMK